MGDSMRTPCWKCGKPMVRTSAAVELFGNLLWLVNVSAMVCWPCACALLTPAGTAKVQRTIAGMKALGLRWWGKFEPTRIEILDPSDGTKLSMNLASSRRP